MGKTLIINDFRAGELTPRTDARPDLKDYYRGCRILEGMMPIIEGGVARVPGTYYVRPVKQIEEGWCLRVTKSGTGTGIVTSDIVGINCGTSCYYFFPAGSTVILTATPDSGSSFAGWLGDGAGMVTRLVLMDGDKVVNAGFALADPYLIGWYKFDEGSGSVVNNYATDGSGGGGLLPNLSVINSYQGLFWTYTPGFGATPQLYFGAGAGADFAWANPNRTIGGVNKSCFGMFVRAKTSGYTEGCGGYMMRTREFYNSGNPGLSMGNGMIYGLIRHAFYFGGNYGYHYVTAGQWRFHFVNSLGEWWVVLPDGTRTLLMSVTLTQTLNFHWISTGCSGFDSPTPTIGYYPGGSSHGDWIIYNQKVLTDSEWAVWYDQLRSRYGMASRSGW